MKGWQVVDVFAFVHLLDSMILGGFLGCFLTPVPVENDKSKMRKMVKGKRVKFAGRDLVRMGDKKI